MSDALGAIMKGMGRAASLNQVVDLLQEEIAKSLVTYLFQNQAFEVGNAPLVLVSTDDGEFEPDFMQYMQKAAKKQSEGKHVLVFAKMEGLPTIEVWGDGNEQTEPERIFVFDIERTQIVPLADYQFPMSD